MCEEFKTSIMGFQKPASDFAGRVWIKAQKQPVIIHFSSITFVVPIVDSCSNAIDISSNPSHPAFSSDEPGFSR